MTRWNKPMSININMKWQNETISPCKDFYMSDWCRITLTIKFNYWTWISIVFTVRIMNKMSYYLNSSTTNYNHCNILISSFSTDIIQWTNKQMFHVVIIAPIMILDVLVNFFAKREILTEFSATIWFILFENVEFKRKKIDRAK